MLPPVGWDTIPVGGDWTCPNCILRRWTPYVGELLIELRVAGDERADALDAIKALAADWRNRDGLRLRLLIGERRLTLGPGFTYGWDSRQLAALAEFGTEPPRVVIG